MAILSGRLYRRAWQIQNRLKRYIRGLFCVHRFPGGHWHVGFLNWHGVYTPSRRSWAFRNRSWPWARFGMPAKDNRFFHVAVLSFRRANSKG